MPQNRTVKCFVSLTHENQAARSAVPEQGKKTSQECRHFDGTGTSGRRRCRPFVGRLQIPEKIQHKKRTGGHVVTVTKLGDWVNIMKPWEHSELATTRAKYAIEDTKLIKNPITEKTKVRQVRHSIAQEAETINSLFSSR